MVGMCVFLPRRTGLYSFLCIVPFGPRMILFPGNLQPHPRGSPGHSAVVTNGHVFYVTRVEHLTLLATGQRQHLRRLLAPPSSGIISTD